MYCEELEWEVLDDAGFGGRGEAAVGKSIVVRLSGLLAGAPHCEQNLPLGTSLPQVEQVSIRFPDPVYRFKIEHAERRQEN
jgi:hypothetical protein